MPSQALLAGLLLLTVSLEAQVPGPASLAPPARARLASHRDSLVAVAGGERVGWLRMVRTSLADGGVRYVETIQVEDAVDLVTAVTADSALRLRRLVQAGEAWDQPMAVSLQVQGDRLQGSATRPGATPPIATRDDPRPMTPEITLVPMLVAATPWAAGQSGTWQLHDAGAGAAVTLSVAVEAFEPASSTGPAAWRVVVRRGSAATRYRVAAEAPWRMLSIASDGVPFRFIAP